MGVAIGPVRAAAPTRRSAGHRADGWRLSVRHLALALGLWAIASQPLLLLIHNAVPHTHPPAGVAERSSHDDHDHHHDRSPPAGSKTPVDEWCPVLQGLKTLGLFLVPVARLAADADAAAALVRLPYRLERPDAARRHDGQPRAPPRL